MTTTEKVPHILIVEDCNANHADGGGHDLDCWTLKLECPGVTDACRMWLECMDCNSKISADLDNDDLYDQLSQTGEAHGVQHVWAGDIGWATWTDKCLAERHEDLYEAVEDLDLTPGRYLVLVSFEDGEYLRLRLVEGEAAA